MTVLRTKVTANLNEKSTHFLWETFITEIGEPWWSVICEFSLIQISDKHLCNVGIVINYIHLDFTICKSIIREPIKCLSQTALLETFCMKKDTRSLMQHVHDNIFIDAWKQLSTRELPVSCESSGPQSHLVTWPHREQFPAKISQSVVSISQGFVIPWRGKKNHLQWQVNWNILLSLPLLKIK